MNIPCKQGDRIRLLAMPDDPNPITSGSTGTVRSVKDFGDWAQVWVDWDCRRKLSLTLPEDKFEVLP